MQIDQIPRQAPTDIGNPNDQHADKNKRSGKTGTFGKFFANCGRAGWGGCHGRHKISFESDVRGMGTDPRSYTRRVLRGGEYGISLHSHDPQKRAVDKCLEGAATWKGYDL